MARRTILYSQWSVVRWGGQVVRWSGGGKSVGGQVGKVTKNEKRELPSAQSPKRRKTLIQY